ncbi:uncharacterized protein LOC111697828 [Eurytemora carolleeae]|uniref:uncharacterized protein LOC111697828 n=1 Tax=Eurytemora carolleeae TaxID=1294199 RepID=UPI000C76AFBA|nr:uncharacterized protein LOC111697828 [Eurytemora carolleeae]|eukprot:XP_023323723.1 uncharacterized protein LOC111697828 [Eurytemora affinis]
MIVTGPQQGYTPGYINYDDLVEGALEGVAEHRASTRQRHLSSGNEDIASSYFATQYGTSKDNSRHASKQTSRQTSRRNSFTTNAKVCSNSYVQSTMATAAAKIAQLKKTERDDNIAKYKEQKSCEQVVQNQCVQQNVQQQNVQHQNVQQESVQQQSVQQHQITQHYESTNQHHQQQSTVMNQHHQQQSTVMNNSINISSTSLANSESEWSPTASNMEISQQQQYNSNSVQQNSSSNNNSRAGSRRNSSQFSYLSLLPEDGSYPHRTQPIGEPMTKRTSSAAPTPDREVGRKWSLTSSQDYMNRTGKGNYAVRSNPIGNWKVSIRSIGSEIRYSSVGNWKVNIRSIGSEIRGPSVGNWKVNIISIGSEIRDSSAGNWKERRSSTADVRGSGIRTGGNLIEPSGKPPSNFFMPFGSSAQNSFTKRKSSKTVQSSEQKHVKRERNRSISGPSGTAMQSLNQALNSIQSNTESEVINVTLTRRPRDRAQSLPRGRVSNEESSFTVSLPGSRRQSRQPSVEPDSKKLSRHGSVEIFDAAYNLTVPNILSRHASQTKLEEVHADHFFFPGAVQDSGTVTLPPQPTVQPSVQCIAVSVHKNPGGGVVEDGSGFSAELSNLTYTGGGVVDDGSGFSAELSNLTYTGGGVVEDGSGFSAELSNLTYTGGGRNKPGTHIRAYK